MLAHSALDGSREFPEASPKLIHASLLLALSFLGERPEVLEGDALVTVRLLKQQELSLRACEGFSGLIPGHPHECRPRSALEGEAVLSGSRCRHQLRIVAGPVGPVNARLCAFFGSLVRNAPSAGRQATVDGPRRPRDDPTPVRSVLQVDNDRATREVDEALSSSSRRGVGVGVGVEVRALPALGSLAGLVALKEVWWLTLGDCGGVAPGLSGLVSLAGLGRL